MLENHDNIEANHTQSLDSKERKPRNLEQKI